MKVEQDAPHSPTNAWNLSIGRDICSNVTTALNHEWLTTNGLGGYASGTIIGTTTRSYHGLLVAALRPPVERSVFVTKIDETIELPNGRILNLGVNEYQDGTLDPQGYAFLDAVSLEGDIPCFRYTLDNLLTLEKRIWMEYGQNTTYVQYILHGAIDEESEKHADTPFLTLSPYCLYRNHHSTTTGAKDWQFLVDNRGNSCTVRAYADAPALTMIADPTTVFTTQGYWYWHVLHRRDTERGLPDVEDVYRPGYFRRSIVPGMRITLVLSAENVVALEEHKFGGQLHEENVASALLRHQRRTKQLLLSTNQTIEHLAASDPVLARLTVAADQFIVARPDQQTPMALGSQSVHLAPDKKTIIAGYPWFTDWGRDSMISLPGLLLDTGRYSEARGLLKAFASFTNQGLIPNRFPDSGEAPEYNTIDATLWMFHALNSYLSITSDWSLLKDLFPTLSSIIDWHVRGTLYGIGVDASDGLLHGGTPGVQLTWMDARVGDQVITPRHGKPVEVNALWYCALACMEQWAVHLSIDATLYSQLRTQVRQHFASRFWYDEGGYLYDVVDVEGTSGSNDPSLRPNQLFAASLTRDLLTDEQISSMLTQVTNHLLTPLGLRSLSPTDPAYHDHFNGGPKIRDGAYHQGAVWQWLIGPYIDVHLRVHNDRAAIAKLLQPLISHIWTTCLGTISEVAEPEPPFTPAGCFAQAWSVAEVLRCWQHITE